MSAREFLGSVRQTRSRLGAYHLVGDSEYVARVDRSFHLGRPLERDGGQYPVKEGTPELPHAVVVRERSPRKQDFVAGTALQLRVGFHGARHPFVIKREIEIDTDPR